MQKKKNIQPFSVSENKMHHKKRAKLGGRNWRPRVKLGPVVPDLSYRNLLFGQECPELSGETTGAPSQFLRASIYGKKKFFV